MKKTILLTGSTDGIGKLAAIKLAKDGHEVYLHGRNAEKLKVVLSEVKSQCGNENIGSFTADFSDLNAVKKMAEQVKREVRKLDVLTNNAGVFESPVAETDDDFDIRFAVNYFAPYLLTNALLPLLKKGKGARILNVSSAAQAPVSLKALEGDNDLSARSAYGQSKLALAMWNTHLSETEPQLTAIVVNPGSLLNTKMVEEAFGYHQSPAEKGGDILYELAVDERYEGASGQYFDNDDGAFGKLYSAARDREAIATLIRHTEALLT
ncbi:SDR family NAD(P)-dependent oxidoreductase [Phaeodactylibacter sp.]|uniref:SDR family NAD(P)-dependent oxidoreductase n=1 Tax=Phaeodactylibacter sp. TaxID=1940289 RepID=UPI0025F5025A|nr:SDR family NAD(P)-dependent oxidoreductase [Phaeodactylibacter sp.]MCI4646662.1 SDR family NAD(P)-dependent oxidoreductase [Phaeodactylibacter sp.]MCI5093709.1 SDR family NAD(P)-dependent oxidoreductase [Phaeodactylibacter sp.]